MSIHGGPRAGEGHEEDDGDDEAFARRLQEEADREHYARLIELTGGHSDLEAAFRGGVCGLALLLTALQPSQNLLADEMPGRCSQHGSPLTAEAPRGALRLCCLSFQHDQLLRVRCWQSACRVLCRLLCSDGRVLPAAGIAEGEEGDGDWTGDEEDQDYLTEDSIDPDDMTYEVSTSAAPCRLALGLCAGVARWQPSSESYA